MESFCIEENTGNQKERDHLGKIHEHIKGKIPIKMMSRAMKR
jgi:hypothetical protein